MIHNYKICKAIEKKLNNTIKLICIDYITQAEEIDFKMVFSRFLMGLINMCDLKKEIEENTNCKFSSIKMKDNKYRMIIFDKTEIFNPKKFLFIEK